MNDGMYLGVCVLHFIFLLVPVDIQHETTSVRADTHKTKLSPSLLPYLTFNPHRSTTDWTPF